MSDEIALPDKDASGDAQGDALKRLRMRSWRRGIREMDLILGPFADEVLPWLDPAERARFEALLAENDHDLYKWLTARIATPDAQDDGPTAYGALLDRIARHAAARIVPDEQR